jgi:hypothetical protein
MRKLPWLIPVMRLITGIPVPKIHRRTGINHECEAAGTGGTWPGQPGPVPVQAPAPDGLTVMTGVHSPHGEPPQRIPHLDHKATC